MVGWGGILSGRHSFEFSFVGYCVAGLERLIVQKIVDFCIANCCWSQNF